MKRIAYARVSSREQSINSHALEQQIARLQAEAVDEIFVDVESAFKGRHRPQLEKVMELVRSRTIGEVVVTRLDRLSRRGVQSFLIFEDFLNAEVVLRVLDEMVDLSTAAGRMTAGVLVVVAQHHSDQKAESVRHGWNHLRNRRVAMNPPFGYTKVEDRHELDHVPFLCLLENHEERSKAMIARQIIETFLERKTLRLTMRAINECYGIQTFAHNNEPGKGKGGKVARDLFRFSPGGLSNWLKNPVLQGHLRYLRESGESKHGRQEIHYNTHPDQRLITDEEGRQIEAILAHNSRVKGYGSTAPKYPCSGLVFCGECRAAHYSMKASKGKNQPGSNYYFQCRNWRPRACGQKTLVRMEKVELAIIEALTARAEVVSQITDSPPEQQEPLKLKELRQQLAQLEVIPGQNPAIEQAKRELRTQIDAFQFQQNQQSAVHGESRELLIQTFSDSSYWKTLLDGEKRQVFHALVEKVVIRDGGIEQVVLKV